MYKTPVILLLSLTLAFANVISSRPRLGFEELFREAYGEQLGDSVRVRRAAGSASGEKCTIVGMEGTCIPYHQCDYDSVPSTAELEQLEVAVKSIEACKEAIEVCCIEAGIDKTRKS